MGLQKIRAICVIRGKKNSHTHNSQTPYLVTFDRLRMTIMELCVFLEPYTFNSKPTHTQLTHSLLTHILSILSICVQKNKPST